MACVAAIQNVWISGLGRFSNILVKSFRRFDLFLSRPRLEWKIVYPFRCGRWTTYSSFPDMKANVWQLLADGLEQVLIVLISKLLAGRTKSQDCAVKKLRLSSMDIVSLERNIEDAARWAVVNR